MGESLRRKKKKKKCETGPQGEQLSLEDPHYRQHWGQGKHVLVKGWRKWTRAEPWKYLSIGSRGGGGGGCSKQD